MSIVMVMIRASRDNGHPVADRDESIDSPGSRHSWFLVVRPEPGEVARRLVGQRAAAGGKCNALRDRLQLVVAPDLL